MHKFLIANRKQIVCQIFIICYSEIGSKEKNPDFQMVSGKSGRNED